MTDRKGEGAMTAQVMFQNEINGYDRDQVDKYVSRLSEAYQTAYDENQAIRASYSNLIEEYRKLEEQVKEKPNSRCVAKTVMQTETLAQKIIDEAHIEAEKLKAEALRVIDSAYEKVAEIEAKARKLTNNAFSKKAGAESAAQRIVDEAHIEADRLISQANSNISKAQEIFGLTMAEIQNLLSFNVSRVNSGVA